MCLWVPHAAGPKQALGSVLRAWRNGTRARKMQHEKMIMSISSNSNDQEPCSEGEIRGPNSNNGHALDLTTPATVEESDYRKFVRFLHLAGPYVVGHRNKTFVILIPGEVVEDSERLGPILEDILLLHGLGVKLVIVVGCKELVDSDLEDVINSDQDEMEGKVIGGHRVSDPATISVVMGNNGAVVNRISAMLSKGPPIPVMRRHAKGSTNQSKSSPSVQVVSGNYVTAKRRGIVRGVDFGLAGLVSSIHVDGMKSQLSDGNIVLLTCMGISSSGDLLNCSVYDVAVQASLCLDADKFICFTGEEVRSLKLPHYLPLEEARFKIQGCDKISVSSGDSWKTLDDSIHEELEDDLFRVGSGTNIDLDRWDDKGIPFEVMSAVTACHNGVSRSHLVDYQEDGAMLLELYSRDGISGVCMIAADLYQGIRAATADDLIPVSNLLELFLSEGHYLPWSIAEVIDKIDYLTVLERDGDILACVAAESIGKDGEGLPVAELSGLIVSHPHRNNGFGDSILDYVEQYLRRQGIRRVVIVGGQGSFDWFVERGFVSEGPAWQSLCIPEHRRGTAPKFLKVYSKPILELDASLDVPAGKRIGF